MKLLVFNYYLRILLKVIVLQSLFSWIDWQSDYRRGLFNLIW